MTGSLLVAAANRAHRVIRGIERLLFVIAAIALGWYATVQIDASREQAALSRELTQSQLVIEAPPSHPVTRPEYAPPPAPPPLRGLVGRIDVPRLRLSALAREGVDTRTLRGSAGHVPGSALPGQPGNAAFAAHRDTFFRPLRGVRNGDEIMVTTPGGEFRYVVSSAIVVEPSDVSVLRATNEPTLTLVTCYPFDYIGSAPQRFVVSARLARR
jgi:sortase A